jgi:hypothetical protein
MRNTYGKWEQLAITGRTRFGDIKMAVWLSGRIAVDPGYSSFGTNISIG